MWTTVQKKLKGVATISRAVSVADNPGFLPSRWDAIFKRWTEKGLTMIDQLFDGSILRSFSDLKEKFMLSSNYFFGYLQIRNYITNHKEREIIKKAPTNVEQYFIAIIKQTPIA